MGGNIFDAFTRHAAEAVSRRTSLLALGGAALAGAIAPAVTSAAKSGKKANRKCRKQGTQCRALVVALCADFEDEEEEQACLDSDLPCCDFFARCKAGPGFDCFNPGTPQEPVATLID